MTDIVKPDVIWIEGRCYRVNDPTSEVTSLQEHDTYENDTPINDLDDEYDDDNVEVVMMDDSRFCTNLHVSK
ncbi:hypothetical protein O3G_MSEX001043 [Manduca sexta]|nr:hypothetical protein O3G_MSEX001043 [Manduca sexta]